MAQAMDWDGQIRQNLQDAACSEDLIEEVLRSLSSKKKEDGLRLLQEHRKTLLATVHEKQKCIDCLDYLLYKLKL